MLSTLTNALFSRLRAEVAKITQAAIAAGVADGINNATEELSLHDFEAEIPEAPILLLDPPAPPARRRVAGK